MQCTVKGHDILPLPVKPLPGLQVKGTRALLQIDGTESTIRRLHHLQ
jgi:hypothetical protein